MPSTELASLAEIAEILGVSRRTAAVYANRDDFPAPVDTLAVGRIWRRRDVDRWAKQHPATPFKRGPAPKRRS